jgi:hypothetical protein
MMEENKQTQNREEKELNQIEKLEEIIQKRLKHKVEKAKVWKDIFKQFEDWILQSLEKGFSKADIHYALNEYVKEKYGKQYLIKANYFYALFKKYFGNTGTTKKPKRETQSASENKTEVASQNLSPKTTAESKKTDLTKKEGLEMDLESSRAKRPKGNL